MWAAVAFAARPVKVTSTLIVAPAGSRLKRTVPEPVAVLLLGGTSWSPLNIALKVSGGQGGVGVTPWALAVLEADKTMARERPPSDFRPAFAAERSACFANVTQKEVFEKDIGISSITKCNSNFVAGLGKGRRAERFFRGKSENFCCLAGHNLGERPKWGRRGSGPPEISLERAQPRSLSAHVKIQTLPDRDGG